ncbi:MAG: FtsX-like permease family protein [Candidatus Latescibacteria bacterium]|nr:FtsX-like permease family protein [Candidatus Latescibacterota bacterium]
MKVWHLVIKEIKHKKLSFSLGVLSVLVAVGVLVAELTLLDAHDLQTQYILQQKEAEIQEKMRVMEDDYRVIMKEMGFNLLILPKDQTLGDYYAEGYVSKDMPEDYVIQLSNTRIMTIRHLLPSIEQKIQWPEKGNRTIILMGTRGEVPFTHFNPQVPILEAIPPGKIVIGYELWRNFNIKTGDTVMLLGKTFDVVTCQPERGTKDDITVWIDLGQAQQLLNKQGRINGILALKCLCEGNDISSIRNAVSEILPNTQVIEFESKSLARAKARDRAKAIADSTLAAERTYRSALRIEREKFASWVIPVVILGCTAWIGLLAFGNVRERKTEIGILRALGLRSSQILSIFLTKAFGIGIIGAFIGYSAGYAMGMFIGDIHMETQMATRLFNPKLLLLVIATAPLLTIGASWVPSLMAARQDPADILREE